MLHDIAPLTSDEQLKWQKAKETIQWFLSVISAILITAAVDNQFHIFQQIVNAASGNYEVPAGLTVRGEQLNKLICQAFMGEFGEQESLITVEDVATGDLLTFDLDPDRNGLLNMLGEPGSDNTYRVSAVMAGARVLDANDSSNSATLTEVTLALEKPISCAVDSQYLAEQSKLR